MDLQPELLGSSEQKYQPLAISGSVAAIVTVTWRSDESTLRLNGRALERIVDPPQPPLLLEGHDLSEDRLEKFLRLSIWGATDAEYLFIGAVQEVAEKLTRADKYCLIRMAGLLRLLLLDGLLHKANVRYRLRLRFSVLQAALEDLGGPSKEAKLVELRLLDPFYFPNAPTASLDLDRLLQVSYGVLEGKTVTIRQLIRAAANAMGGVHFGTYKSEEQIVADFDGVLRPFNNDSTLAALADVGHVVLDGLWPLTEAISQNGFDAH